LRNLVQLVTNLIENFLVDLKPLMSHVEIKLLRGCRAGRALFSQRHSLSCDRSGAMFLSFSPDGKSVWPDFPADLRLGPGEGTHGATIPFPIDRLEGSCAL
jgi:hypothetical protein